MAESFVVGFRQIMLVSAGLALASALVAALMVGGKGSGGSQEARQASRAALLVWELKRIVGRLLKLLWIQGGLT